MENFLIGAASNTLSTVVTVAFPQLVEIIDDIRNFDQNTQLLEDKLTGLKALLEDLKTAFQDDQRSTPETVKLWLRKLEHSLQEARRLMDRSQQQKQCLDCLFRKPKLSRQIREWRTNFDKLSSEHEQDFSVLCHAQQIAASTPLPPVLHDVQQIALSTPLPRETLLQPVPAAGFVGLGIQDAEKRVQAWLNTEDHQFGVIGIYGMGGIGKTSLLKKVYNTCKQGTVFQAAIWITASKEDFNIGNMQKVIAGPKNLNLGTSSSPESGFDSDTLKMSIFACLKNMKFLIVLDDLWSSLDLQDELGIPVSNEKGSRVLISTRSEDVIRRMSAKESSIKIQPLSEEEGWELFCRKAFKDGVAPTKSIEDVARLIAGECKGLPLAINVVAAAVMANSKVDEWDLTLSEVKNVDLDFLTDTGIDKDLYQRLKWSYDRLSNSNLQNCFLYCGAFPEDKKIDVELLVEMWIGEGLVGTTERSYLLDKGRRCVKVLVDRGLFEYASADMRYIKVHDIVRDMAIYVAKKQENCFFWVSRNLVHFPRENEIVNSKRISIGCNDIPSLPTDLTCPNLLALFLAQNASLTRVPDSFFINVTSLRVLDMSRTKIESLPASMWHLAQLEFLDLSYTSIKNLPEDICNLVRLQFLHLSCCTKLESLPSKVGELQTLKHLSLLRCERLTEIPREISQLTSLDKLNLWWTLKGLKTEEARSGICTLKDLTNIPNLTELWVCVKPGIEVNGIRSGIKAGIMSSWLEMRHLEVLFDVDDGNDDVVMEDLPQDMHHMKKLQFFLLLRYRGRSLPNCICDFEQLEHLDLTDCGQLSELPLLEKLPNLKYLEMRGCKKLRELGIGRLGSAAGFPALEVFYLFDLPMLESMKSLSSNIVWSEGLMPNLQSLEFAGCPSLKRVPEEIVKLPKLKEIVAKEDWWENLIWEDDNVPKLLKDKLKKPPSGW